MGYQLVTNIPYTDLLAVGCWTPIIAAHASASALRKFVALGWTQPHQRTTHRHKRLVRKGRWGRFMVGFLGKIRVILEKSCLKKKWGMQTNKWYHQKLNIGNSKAWKQLWISTWLEEERNQSLIFWNFKVSVWEWSHPTGHKITNQYLLDLHVPKLSKWINKGHSSHHPESIYYNCPPECLTSTYISKENYPQTNQNLVTDTQLQWGFPKSSTEAVSTPLRIHPCATRGKKNEPSLPNNCPMLPRHAVTLHAHRNCVQRDSHQNSRSPKMLPM